MRGSLTAFHLTRTPVVRNEIDKEPTHLERVFGGAWGTNTFPAGFSRTRAGLAVVLKNDLDQIPGLADEFDLSVNEQCHEFDECAALQPFIDAGKPVVNAEYTDPFVTDATARTDLCTQALNQNVRTLVLPLDLDDAFRFSCDP